MCRLYWLQISMSASSQMKRLGASANVSTSLAQWSAGVHMELLEILALKVVVLTFTPLLVSTHPANGSLLRCIHIYLQLHQMFLIYICSWWTVAYCGSGTGRAS